MLLRLEARSLVFRPSKHEKVGFQVNLCKVDFQKATKQLCNFVELEIEVLRKDS